MPELTRWVGVVGGVGRRRTIPDAGTYTLNGTAAVFTYTDGSSGTATVSGNTFTVAAGGYSQVYKKE